MTVSGAFGALSIGACSSFTAVPPSATMDAEAVDASSACADATFCDDFDDPLRDAGWSFAVDDAMEADGGPVGSIFVGPEGRSSPRALHVTGYAFSSLGFHNARWAQNFATGAQSAELSFSIYVSVPTFALEAGKAQLAFLGLPGALVYPVLTPGGLAFAYTSNGVYLEPDSTVAFGFDAWHTMTLALDLVAGRVRATIDGREALVASFTSAGNTGIYTAAVGLRTQQNTSALEIRYDDVVVRLR